MGGGGTSLACFVWTKSEKVLKCLNKVCEVGKVELTHLDLTIFTGADCGAQ